MRNIFKATLIVTIFAVATRALGFLLRIYLSRVMGAETLGAYQISMSFFGVLLTIISSGIPLVVSRNVAYYTTEKDTKTQNKFITAGLILALSISVILSVIIYVFPSFFVGLIGQESLAIVYILLPALWASAIYAVLRGGLWGRKYFFTISFTEFFEQLVRIIFVVILFNLPQLSMTSGQISALSLTLSAVCSCVLVLTLYFAFKGRFSFSGEQLKILTKTSTPITLVKSASAIVASIIAVILPARLMMFGYTHGEALAQFGIFMGMVLPLIMVPNTFVGSICVALVPEISAHTNSIDRGIVKDINGLKEEILGAIKSSTAISFVLIPAFTVLGGPICQILFNNAHAGVYLSVFACLMFPLAICQVVTSVLNAVGLEKKALINYIIGASALLICVIFLPKYIGSYAMGLGFGLMNIISATLGIIILKKRKIIGYCETLKTGVFCTLISVPVVLITYFVQNIFTNYLPLFFATAISGGLCVVCNILLMVAFNVANLKIVAIKVTRKKKTPARA